MNKSKIPFRGTKGWKMACGKCWCNYGSCWRNRHWRLLPERKSLSTTVCKLSTITIKKEIRYSKETGCQDSDSTTDRNRLGCRPSFLNTNKRKLVGENRRQQRGFPLCIVDSGTWPLLSFNRTGPPLLANRYRELLFPSYLWLVPKRSNRLNGPLLNDGWL